MEPEALPCRSKCAGKISGREVHWIKIAAALTATIINGIIQPRLEFVLPISIICPFVSKSTKKTIGVIEVITKHFPTGIAARSYHQALPYGNC